MTLFLSILFCCILILTCAIPLWSSIRNKKKKVLMVQIGIIMITAVLGIMSIYYLQIPSVAEILTKFIFWP